MGNVSKSGIMDKQNPPASLNSAEKTTTGRSKAQIKSEPGNPVKDEQTSKVRSCQSTIKRSEDQIQVAEDSPKPLSRGQPDQNVPPEHIYSSTYNAKPPTTSPIRIRWQGFEESRESSGEICLFCQLDLSTTEPIYNEAYDDHIELEFSLLQEVAEFSLLQEVAVLPCGHAYHAKCLELYTPGADARDPPCLLCVCRLSFS